MLQYISYAFGVAMLLATGPTLAQSQPLASAEGPNGMTFEVTQLTRDESALMLKGRLVNGNNKKSWGARSFKYLYLIDNEAGQKASPLSTAQGDCLCSERIGSIRPGESKPVFAKFPLPTGDASKVDVVYRSFLPMEDVPITDVEDGAGKATGGRNI